MIRVLIAEDMHMIRGALVALLKLEPDIEVVASSIAATRSWRRRFARSPTSPSSTSICQVSTD